MDYQAEAERVIRGNLTPYYPPDMPIGEMTQFERGFFKQWVPAVAAALQALNNKLPCGHRFVDWDDSYGGCAFCSIQQQAFDYDKLPHEVIECHDKIEVLEAEVAKLTAERDELQAERDGYEIDKEHNAAVVQGLEIAQEIVGNVTGRSITEVLTKVQFAIAAELSKRKEPA